MPLTARTFRVFISSTFSDMKAERNALQEQVFPRLRALALAHGCRFQAVDLRWGVSDEASLDQQTMKICLGEIERCQRASPRPNFIVLLGDRYGWRPLPEEIPADEFEAILAYTLPEEIQLLRSWYQLDENAVPPVYCLRPRTGEYSEYSAWEKVEKRVRQVFQKAVEELGFPTDRKLKFTASATEQEVYRGALQVSDAREHVFCFFRRIDGLPGDGSAGEWLDLDDSGRPDGEAKEKLESVKQRLEAELAGNVHHYTTGWTGTGITTGHISQLCEDVYNDLSRIILEEIGKMEDVPPLQKEIADHREFAGERARYFVGRVELLQKIEEYIQGDEGHPLVLSGGSGSGKSALMARCLEEVQQTWPEAAVVARFIGATPDSTVPASLLKSLCEQIYQLFDFEGLKQAQLESDGSQVTAYAHLMYGESMVVSTGADMINKEFAIPEDPLLLPLTFLDFLKKVPDGKRLVIFLDALDQLGNAGRSSSLTWFPTELPPNVRLVASTIPGEALSILKGKLPSGNIIEVEPMSQEEGRALLDLWLDDAGRKLQPGQRQVILDRFAASGLPIYLKLAFEQARRWRSDETGTTISVDTPGVLGELFARLSQESSHGAVLVDRCLGYLGAARFGLTEDELVDLLSADQEVLADFHRRSPRSPVTDRIPVVIWSRLYFDLEPYLTERSGDGTRLLAFFHRQFTEVVSADHLAGPDAINRHRLMAEYFASQRLEVDFPGGRTPNLRRFSELAYHQMEAGLWDDLAANLCDLRSIELACRSGMVYQLLEDHAAAMARLPDAHTDSLKEREVRETLVGYARDLSALSSGAGQAAFPAPPAARRPRDEAQLKVEVDRITRTPTSLERVEAFSKFLDVEAQRLARYGSIPLFTIQQAYNSAREGPVAKAAEAIFEAEPDSTAFLRSPATRPPFNPRPFCLRAMGGETSEGGRDAYCVDITPDGRLAFAGGLDQVYLWDLSNGQCLQVMDSPGFQTAAICISPDGKRGASTDSKEIRLWDLEMGRCTRRIPYEEKQATIFDLQMDPGGRFVLSHGCDEHIRLWDSGTGECRAIPVGLGVQKMVLAQNGSFFATGDLEGNLKIWSLPEGNLLGVINGRDKAVGMVNLSADGKRAISTADSSQSDRDEVIRVWELESGKCLASATANAIHVNSAVFSADGSVFALGSDKGILSLWDASSNANLRTFNYPAGGVKQFLLTADAALGIILADDNAISVWDLLNGWQPAVEKPPVERTLAPVLTPDGSRCLAAERSTSQPILWDLNRKKIVCELRGNIGPIERLWANPALTRAISTQDPLADINESNHYRPTVWNLENMSNGPFETYLHSAHTAPVCLAGFSPDNSRAVTVDEKGAVYVWNILPTIILHHFDLEDTPGAMAIGPDGRSVLLAGGGYGPFKNKDSFLQWWDLETGKLLRDLVGHQGYVDQVQFTPSGDQAISTARDNTLRLWDLQTGTLVRELPGSSFSISAEGTRLFSTSTAGEIQVWSLPNGECLTTMGKHERGNLFLEIDPGCDHVITTDRDNTASLWETGSGKRLALLPSVPQQTLAGRRLRIVDGSDLSVYDLHGLKPETPLVTPVRLWLFGPGGKHGKWDGGFTVLCDWCGRRFGVEAQAKNPSFMEKLRGKGAGVNPVEAIECPACHNKLRLTPFVVDAREIYK